MTTPLTTRHSAVTTSGTGPSLPASSATVADVMEAFGAVQLRAEALLRLVARAHGFGVSDLRALYFIHAGTAVTPSQVSAYLDLSSGATTSLVDRLGVAGYVNRAAHPTDRRSNILQIAPAGIALIDEEISFYLSVFGGIEESIKLADVAAALDQIAHSMTAHGKERFGDAAFS